MSILPWNWSAITDEAVELLQRLLKIDTTNPPGNELAAARFLQSVLARDGVESQLLESAPGRANLIARLEGQQPGRALMWMHHMDVVPASDGEWSVPAFAGSLRDGELWGRGAIDNKGGGIAQLLAFLLAKRLGTRLERDLVLLAVADEESGGAHGARWLVEQHAELFSDVEYILNEGGGILELPGGKLLYSVELAQKAPLWLRVTARGKSGHGSSPGPNGAAAVLVRALARVADHQFPLQVLPEVQALFSARAAALPPAQRKPYQNLKASLEDAAFREKFLQNPHDAALVRTTLAITMLSGSSKENVISDTASALLDVRLLPGQDPARIQAELQRVLGEPALELSPVLSWQAQRSSADTRLYRAIEKLAQQQAPGAPVSLNVIGGFTDCNAFRAHGKTCYGFLPLRIRLDELERIHGKDERIALDVASQGVLQLHALLGLLGE